MKKLIAVLCASAMLLVLCSCSILSGASASSSALTYPKAADGQFNTPEKAIEWFADSLKKNDFMKATEAFAVYELPDHFNYKAWTEYTKMVTLGVTSFMPEQYKDINRALMINNARIAYVDALFTLTGHDYVKGEVQKSDSDVAAFVSSLAPDKLTGITVSSEEEATEYEGNRMDKYQAMYGADDCKIYHVTLELGGKKAVADMLTLLKYSGNWKILAGLFTTPSN